MMIWTGARTRHPEAVHDRARSRLYGCYPAILDGRCTSPEVRKLREMKRWLADLDTHGSPRWFRIIAWTLAITLIAWGAYYLTAGTLDQYGPQLPK